MERLEHQCVGGRTSLEILLCCLGTSFLAKGHHGSISCFNVRSVIADSDWVLTHCIVTFDEDSIDRGSLAGDQARRLDVLGHIPGSIHGRNRC